MGDMRPGVKVRFWSPKFKHKPAVEPPGLLRLISGLCVFSVVGVLLYAVAISLDGIRYATPSAIDAAYIAVLHFLLPLSITYTVTGNYPSSRFLLSVYFIVLYGATMMGKGFLATVGSNPTARAIVATGLFVVLIAWLFRSPRMRIYYVLLRDQPVPDDLADRAWELAAKSSLSPKTKRFMEWLTDHLETVVLVGFIVLVIYAWASMKI